MRIQEMSFVLLLVLIRIFNMHKKNKHGFLFHVATPLVLEV